MTEKGVELLQSINDGKKLYMFKSVILRNNTTTYKLESKPVHPAIVKSLLNDDLLMRGNSTKTLGGWKTELLIKH